MKKIYYLKTCDTCKKIMKQIKDLSQFELQDIKETEITAKQLEEMYAFTKSYEKLFSRRAKLYKERGLKDEILLENDFKNYILEHYTFLNRPVIIYDEQLFVGSAKGNVEEALNVINK